MIENPDRWPPIKSSVYSLLFPGYFYWRRNNKIEGLSISLAVFFAYFLLIGYILHLICIYKNWKDAKSHNEKWGYESLDQDEADNLTIIGIFGGIFGQPVLQFLSIFWLIDLGYYTQTEGPIRINTLALTFILILLFILRYFLMYTLISIRSSDDVDMKDIFDIFTKNNSSLMLLSPSFTIVNLPLTPLVNTIIVFVLIPLGIFMGTRTLYMNFTSIKVFTSK